MILLHLIFIISLVLWLPVEDLGYSEVAHPKSENHDRWSGDQEEVRQ